MGFACVGSDRNTKCSNLATTVAVHQEKFGFIHVPKTGGTWAVHAMQRAGIELTVMGEGSDRHVPYSGVPGPFRFGFVRDPAMWYRSHWAHKRRHEDYPEVMDPFHQAIRASTDFPDFVERATAAMPRYVTNLYEHFLGPPGAIEYIGHQENLVEDLVTALELTGVEFDPAAIRSVPPLNEGTDDMPQITPELRELIRAAEHNAFERFGY